MVIFVVATMVAPRVWAGGVVEIQIDGSSARDFIWQTLARVSFEPLDVSGAGGAAQLIEDVSFLASGELRRSADDIPQIVLPVVLSLSDGRDVAVLTAFDLSASSGSLCASFAEAYPMSCDPAADLDCSNVDCLSDSSCDYLMDVELAMEEYSRVCTLLDLSLVETAIVDRAPIVRSAVSLSSDSSRVALRVEFSPEQYEGDPMDYNEDEICPEDHETLDDWNAFVDGDFPVTSSGDGWSLTIDSCLLRAAAGNQAEEMALDNGLMTPDAVTNWFPTVNQGGMIHTALQAQVWSAPCVNPVGVNVQLYTETRLDDDGLAIEGEMDYGPVGDDAMLCVVLGTLIAGPVGYMVSYIAIDVVSGGPLSAILPLAEIFGIDRSAIFSNDMCDIWEDPDDPSGSKMLFECPLQTDELAIRTGWSENAFKFDLSINALLGDMRGLEVSGSLTPVGDLEIDYDDDGVPDWDDNCPANYNPAQCDEDNDGVGTAVDTDPDDDGLKLGDDNCPYVYNLDQADDDDDGRGDVCDNCSQVDNPDWEFCSDYFVAGGFRANDTRDLPSHFIAGRACDEGDDDDDCVLDEYDNCPYHYNPVINGSQPNTNADDEERYGWPERGDACDPHASAILGAYNFESSSAEEGSANSFTGGRAPRFRLSLFASFAVEHSTWTVELQSCRCLSWDSCTACDPYAADTSSSWFRRPSWIDEEIYSADSEDALLDLPQDWACTTTTSGAESLSVSITRETSDDGRPHENARYYAFCPAQEGVHMVRALLHASGDADGEGITAWTKVLVSPVQNYVINPQPDIELGEPEFFIDSPEIWELDMYLGTAIMPPVDPALDPISLSWIELRRDEIGFYAEAVVADPETLAEEGRYDLELPVQASAVNAAVHYVGPIGGRSETESLVLATNRGVFAGPVDGLGPWTRLGAPYAMINAETVSLRQSDNGVQTLIRDQDGQISSWTFDGEWSLDAMIPSASSTVTFPRSPR